METTNPTLLGFLLLGATILASAMLIQRRAVASAWRRRYRCTEGKHRRTYSDETHEDSKRPVWVECADCEMVLQWLPIPAPDEIDLPDLALYAWYGEEPELEVVQVGDWGDPVPFDDGSPVLVHHA